MFFMFKISMKISKDYMADNVKNQKNFAHLLFFKFSNVIYEWKIEGNISYRTKIGIIYLQNKVTVIGHDFEKCCNE